ncbi:hypothetical protein [Vibrio parahaemolyticus]|uniref:hypothetical protein n=1 Tax=Vibrio parahaemolyticus TaxID=670 RepID=UPI000A3C0F92|nr:hypothetical protein [Vibrio parahaemolyticus]OUJ46323.1 hypothetical protein BTZ53_10935 [Vibrio parahaemolyticus]HCG6030288.1 hypothetical protein [Vibrio parahaemolyticus]HDF8527425.1 hypothetical protein [Vibrio parahaemolyticus]
MDSKIDPRLLQLLQDPSKLAALTKLLEDQEDAVPTTFAPFYRNKHGKITKGHLGIAKMLKGLELTPIYEEEAIKLGLMTVEQAKASKENESAEPTKDLNNPSEEEEQAIRARAKELDIPNWHVKGVSRLRGEIAKAERKLSEGGEE